MISATRPFGSFLACALILPTILTGAFIRGFDVNDTEMLPDSILLNSITADVGIPEMAAADFDGTYSESTSAIGDDAALGIGTVISTRNIATNRGNTAASCPSEIEPDNHSVIISDIRSSLISADNRPCLWVGQEIAAYAVQFDGYDYVYGGASPSVGFDCSGLVYYVYGHFGYQIPRTAHLQYTEGTSINKEELQPGDLVFFATNGSGKVSHAGIYVGSNQFINAMTTNQGVQICSLDETYWSKTFVGATRIVTDATACTYLYQTVNA